MNDEVYRRTLPVFIAFPSLGGTASAFNVNQIREVRYTARQRCTVIFSDTDSRELIGQAAEDMIELVARFFVAPPNRREPE